MEQDFQKRIYEEDFSDWEHVVSEFAPSYGRWGEERNKAALGSEPEYIFARYLIDGYEGSADVVFYRDGKWFYNSGSHCSCYGLEDQWEPEEFDAELQLSLEAEEALKSGKRYIRFYSYGYYSDKDGDEVNSRLNTWLKQAVAEIKNSHG